MKRPHVAPTDDWQQLALLAKTPERPIYEFIRPIVLFGRSLTERAHQAGTAERAFYRRAARVDARPTSLSALSPDR